MPSDEKRIDVINFIGPVNDQSVNQFSWIIGMIINGYDQFTFRTNDPTRHKSSEVRIHLSSSGGDVYQAQAAYEQINILKQHVPSVITYNLGHVASSAVIIYLAADIRLASPLSVFLIHAHTYTPSRDETLSVRNLRGAARNLEMHTEIITAAMQQRTRAASEAPEAFEALAHDGTVGFDASRAKIVGIVTGDPVEANIPAGAIIWDVGVR